MPFVYVALSPSVDKGFASSGRAYRLLLPSASGEWPELSVRPSKLGGYGAYPASSEWRNVGNSPILLPYFGAETVTKDQHAQKMLLAILKGAFERVTVGELSAAAGGAQSFFADGIFAVAESDPRSKRTALPPDTKLLQVSYGASVSCVCYLLADEARAALHLVGTRAHLFDLLCAHAKHEHTDRHLATHVATVYRKEEGYVLINAHPAFIDPIGITGMVNEPPANVSSTMKMVQAYARLLPDGDPLLAELGRTTQPKGAVAAWRANILAPEGSSMAANGDVSERMVFYATTRRHYPSELELTVDYGKSYVRDYPSGQHKAAVKAPQAPKDALGAYQLISARWPKIPGWFNPQKQPQRRPAFRVGPRGEVFVCSDDPQVVQAQKDALEPTTPIAKKMAHDRRRDVPSPPPKMLEKRGRHATEHVDDVRRGLGRVFKAQKVG